jgi:hypothetical protein
MLAYEIWLNGRKVCVAGGSTVNVLSAVATWVERANVAQGHPSQVELRVGGSLSRPAGQAQLVEWARATLTPGDELRLVVVDTAEVDSPIQAEPL